MDRSFVQNLGLDSEDDDALALAMISMAKALKLDVIAEGVETEAQFNWLVQNGCELVQGYFTGRPTSSNMFAARYLQSNATVS
jgi:EAL domain-containing protein (putative c-di-GMP-specific phosphodiesterase class I)